MLCGARTNIKEDSHDEIKKVVISSWLSSLSRPARTSTSYKNTPRAQSFMMSEDKMRQVMDCLD